ncbi:MAG: hypothetical protein KC877_01835 [Candidatus Kaiserbacteria bacterium]|nr:hypothetical protein [Candidatus Kaiserbacteria bacterium]MCB9815909.1 hypothetical protein [Candidatus Nomurabacteria bacterium]
MRIRDLMQEMLLRFGEAFVRFVVRNRIMLHLSRNKFSYEAYISLIVYIPEANGRRVFTKMWQFPVRKQSVTEREAVRMQEHYRELQVKWLRAGDKDDVFRLHDVYYVAERIGEVQKVGVMPSIECVMWLQGPMHDDLAASIRKSFPYFWWIATGQKLPDAAA